MHFFLTHYRNLFAFLRNLSQVDLSRACCPKFVTYINVRITTISSHFLTIYTNICHRTEVQIIILRYLTGLKLNWFKSYDTNEEFLLQRETEILTFCAITFEPIMAQTCSVGEKWLELVGKRPFLSSKFWATGSDFNDFFILNFFQVMQRASVVTTAGDAITILRGISCLSPRGKYDITIYPTYFSLHGKTYDFKIPASTVMRLFLLPHKGKKN